jgi:hypothetical protein
MNQTRGFDVLAWSHRFRPRSGYLAAVLVRGMGRQLGGRQLGDQPSTAGVHERELEHVSEKGAIRVRV